MVATVAGAALLLSLSIATAEEPVPRVVSLEPLLVAGPEPAPPPAFHDAEDHSFGPLELLGLDPTDLGRLDPRVGDSLRTATGTTLTWAEEAAFFLPSSTARQRALAATSIQVDRYVEAKLVARTFHPLRVLVDGDEVGKQTKTIEAGGELAEMTATLKLEPGAHRVVMVSVFDPTGSDDWSIAAELQLDDDARDATVDVTAGGPRPVSVDDMLDTPAVSSIHASPDGALVAVLLRHPEVPADHATRWLEIRDAQDGSVVWSTAGIARLSGFDWHPKSPRRFRYTETRDGKSTVHLGEVGGGSRPILRDVERLGGVRWTRDGESLVYSVGDKPDDKNKGLKRMRGLTDRWPGQRTVSHLYQASIEPGGLRRRLTAGPLSAALQDTSPDGSRLLFSTTDYGLVERPFSTTRLYELDLDSLAVNEVRTTSTFRSATYAPDGERLLVHAGRSFAHERAFINLRGTVPPNDYDGQLFIVRRRDGHMLRMLTGEFHPSVSEATWAEDGKIYLRAEDGLAVRMYSFDELAIPTGVFTPIDAGVDAVERMSVSADGRTIGYVGSGASMPPRVMALDTADTTPRTLFVPGDDAIWSRVELGAVERFDFESSTGTPILGRVHLPVDYDPSRRYPAIVYYYAGTSPTSMRFGGRYPIELWCAHGYLVYNLIPSGAPGQGAEFANRHVNDWSRTTAPEILEGTDRLLKAYPVDEKRVGIIGASYGGFMTMRLVTLTDRYACAISHAGISSISSYWGEGHWGYLYSAVATADRYPWSDRELYVGESPLFHADDIHTPLLLLHGTADTNVPVGESEQLYTALRVLGREVEFIKIEGENHHILDYPKRKRWMKTILAWFDKHLKDQPQWWDAQWN